MAVSTSSIFQNLSSILENQLLSNSSLDISSNGQIQKYGKLGEFAKKFDQTAERRYVEQGYYQNNFFGSIHQVQKNSEVLFQEPEATILVKKRMFSTLAENTRLDYMDFDEKLFYKASKILFQNKANQIAAFEKLSKIERVSVQMGQVDTQLFPFIVSLADLIKDNFYSGESNKFFSAVDKIRQISAFQKTNTTTTWLSDTLNTYKSQVGAGTGVLELTNVTNFTTNVGLDLSDSGNLSIVDPYGLMLVTNDDIEKALSDAMHHTSFDVTLSVLESSYNLTLKILNESRANRHVNPVLIKLNPDSVFNKKVQVLIDGLGYEVVFDYYGLAGVGKVTISESAKFGSPDLGKHGLNEKEVGLVETLIKQAYNSFSIKYNGKSTVKKFSYLSNYARRKLRLYYGNKLIIQPMDQIHIFVNSKSRMDNKILGGLKSSFNAFSLLNQVNHTVDSLNNFFGTSNTSEIEKSIFVGSDFPGFMWHALRNLFVNDKEGTHIFAGIVTSSNLSYNDGRYTVGVNFSNNSEFFKMGYLNVTPGLDNFLGPTLDPLTPFSQDKRSIVSTNFSNEDHILLDENKNILQVKLLKHKQGPNFGKIVTENNLSMDMTAETLGSVKNIFYSPDGFVYRWKEGITTVVQDGDSFLFNQNDKIGIPSLTSDPFGGQDIMNVISLLVTGLPYNFNTFFKAAKDHGNLQKDPYTHQYAISGFTKSLSDKLTKSNLLWGHFIPFKSLSIDDKLYSFILNGQVSLQQSNDKIDQLLQEKQKYTNQIYVYKLDSKEAINAKDNIKKINTELNNQISEFNKNLQQHKSTYTIIGNDISFDTDTALGISGNKLDSDTRKELRKKINFLTRRLSWQVKSNEDHNLFIVDDSYEKDYDIMAFDKSLSKNLDLFANSQLNVLEKISSVKKILQLEVFFNTQGHLVVRPPQYNKIPSSVHYKMLNLKNELGVELYPSYLEKLFVDQLTTAVKNIEIIEDQIRLDGFALGLTSDSDISKFLGGYFSFLSNQDGDIISVEVLNSISGDPENINANEVVSFSKKIYSQINLTNVFDAVTRSNHVRDLLNQYNDLALVYNDLSKNDQVAKIKERIFIKSGIQIQLNNYLFKDDQNVVLSNFQVPDIIKITKELSSKIKDRQNYIKLAAASLKNSIQNLELSKTDNSLTNQLKSKKVFKNVVLPDMFDSLLEDESFDDYGPGSGSRYIIKNVQIKNLTIEENPADTTAIEVIGQINPYDKEAELGASFPGGGNRLTTAYAVDYDLWRLYGFKQGEPLRFPFFSDAKKQSAPFAASYLLQNRKKILRGSVTISGNEYIQPGEVYYLEEYDLLFYCEKVSHNFTYGSSFDTTLTLTYGHNPGEYIPTWVDIIGKLLYKNQNTSNYINHRYESITSNSGLGTTIIDTNKTGQDMVFGGKYGSRNLAILNNILYTTQFAIAQNENPNSNFYNKIEIRIYYDNKWTTSSPNSKLLEAGNLIKKYLSGQISIKGSDNNSLKSIFISKNYISDPIAINKSEDGESRSPSQQAISAIFDITSTSQGSVSGTPLIEALYGLVIDCFLVKSPKE